MFILIALAMSSLMENNSVSWTVVWPAKILEDDIYCSSL